MYVGSQLLIWKNLKEQGRSYVAMQYITHNDEIKGYTSRAREVYDGHFPTSDIYFDKYNDVFLPANILPPLIEAVPLFIFRGNINLAYLSYQFLASGIIFIIFYFLSYFLFHSRLWAVFLSFTAVLTPIARSLPRTLLSMGDFLNIVVKNFIPIVNTKMENLFLHKLDDPLTTFLIYIPAITFLFIFWTKPRRVNAILFGLFLGLLTYTYFHYWTYLVVVSGILFIYSLARRDFQRSKLFLIAFGIAVIMFLPYIVNYLRVLELDSIQDWIDRMGVHEFIGRSLTFKPIFGHYLFYIIAAGLVYWFFWKKGERDRALIFWAFLAAMPVVWNIQLVTGYNLLADHWFLAFTPAAFLLLAGVLYKLLSGAVDQKIVKKVLLVLILLLVSKKIVNVAAFIKSDQAILEKYEINAAMADSWKWINDNIAGEPKIASPSFLSVLYLPVYTAARPYVPSWFNTFASTFEMEERFLNINKLFRLPTDLLETTIRLRADRCEEIAVAWKRPDLKCNLYTRFNLSSVMDHIYHTYWRQKNYGTVTFVQPKYDIPEWKVQELLKRYQERDLKWSDLDADYVYYGPWEREITEIDLRQEKQLELIYANSEAEIYKIKK